MQSLDSRELNKSAPADTGKVTKQAHDSKSAQQDAESNRLPLTAQEQDTLKLKKAWDLAITPLKQLPMKFIGIWMTGNTLQIFSIYMLSTLFKEPIAAIANVGPAFSKLETESTRDRMIWVRLVYVLCNFAILALGIWKVDKMGLLPTTRSDWLAWESPRVMAERAIPASPWDWASES